MSPDSSDQTLDETPGSEDESTPNEKSQDALEALTRERDALQDRLLRTAAEWDNYRKRMDRERRELSDYAVSDVLMALIPVIDSLEGAVPITVR